MRCSCGREIGNDKRLPRGWHREPATKAPICAECWSRRYILRAVAFPVAGPVGASWDEFRPALADAWQKATQLTNWGVQELLKADVVRDQSMAKLPSMPRIQLYALKRGSFSGWSNSATAVLRSVELKYRKTRYDRIWLGAVALPNAKYPVPYPVHNAAWKASYGKDNVPLVFVSLPAGKFVLRLRGGKEFRRQLAAFRKIVEGDAIQGELSLYRQRANAADHRNGTNGRDSGEQRVGYRVMCKLVAWLPRETQRANDGTLFVRTDRDSLLVALDAKAERLWVENADHVRRWTAEHARRLNRWSDDQKAEQRPTARYQSRREAAAGKYRRRLDSACHEIASHLAKFAARRRYAQVEYNDSERGFCERFPWAKLKGLVQQKLDAFGISLVSSGAVSEKTAAPLASSEEEE